LGYVGCCIKQKGQAINANKQILPCKEAAKKWKSCACMQQSIYNQVKI
jgi:hypothetical protein